MQRVQNCGSRGGNPGSVGNRALGWLRSFVRASLPSDRAWPHMALAICALPRKPAGQTKTQRYCVRRLNPLGGLLVNPAQHWATRITCANSPLRLRCGSRKPGWLIKATASLARRPIQAFQVDRGCGVPRQLMPIFQGVLRQAKKACSTRPNSSLAKRDFIRAVQSSA